MNPDPTVFGSTSLIYRQCCGSGFCKSLQHSVWSDLDPFILDGADPDTGRDYPDPVDLYPDPQP